MTKPTLPREVQNVFTTDAVAMLCGLGEYKMRQFIGRHREALPPARYVRAWQVGNHAGSNRVRVFTTDDVVVIREVVAKVKAAKKAAWQARMVRRRLRWAGKGVEAWRWRSRAGPYGEGAQEATNDGTTDAR
jgi:hypothetical protein